MLLPLNRILLRQCRLAPSFILAQRAAGNITINSAQSQTLNKNFWEKNKQLNRPISPHLSVYQPQITSVLSILHRLTGLGAGVVLYAGGIGALFCTNTAFPEIVQFLQENVPQFLTLTAKAAIGGSLAFHTLNGIRHLVWDVGYGFQLKHLYLSGYIVVALTAIGTAFIFIKG